MKHFTPEYVKLAVLRADGGISIMSYITLGRGPALPSGANWVGLGGLWRRSIAPEYVDAEVARTDFGSPAVSWQVIGDGFALQSERDYRNALVCEGGVLKHDMTRARERCREMLRGERANVMPLLDGEWMRAVGRKDKAEEDRVEAERQKWRDAPADPRIEAAATVEELKQIKVT